MRSSLSKETGGIVSSTGESVGSFRVVSEAISRKTGAIASFSGESTGSSLPMPAVMGAVEDGERGGMDGSISVAVPACTGCIRDFVLL